MPDAGTTHTGDLLRQLLAQRILVLDGAMGTMIHALGLSDSEVRGARFRDHKVELRNCTDLLVLTQPWAIEQIHRGFLEAGADIIETDTFNATAFGLREFGLEEYVTEINRTAASLARRVADEFVDAMPDRPRLVAGSIGPTNVALSMSPKADDPGFRAATFDDIATAYGGIKHVPPRPVRR